MIENAMVIPISKLIYEGFTPLMNWGLIKHLVVGWILPDLETFCSQFNDLNKGNWSRPLGKEIPALENLSSTSGLWFEHVVMLRFVCECDYRLLCDDMRH